MIINGAVENRQGLTVGKALISIEWASVIIPEFPIWTDDSGQFKIDLPQGQYRIVAHVPSQESSGSIDIIVKDKDINILILVNNE